MPAAVGMVEVRGLPPSLAAADAMCKAASVTLVSYEKLSGGFYTVVVRGDIAEVQVSVAAGVEAAKQLYPHKENDKLFLSSHVIARPDLNIVTVLPIDYNPATEQFRLGG